VLVSGCVGEDTGDIVTMTGDSIPDSDIIIARFKKKWRIYYII
jgi:hypothetical protein